MLIPKKFGLKATAAKSNFPAACPCPPPLEASQRLASRTGVHKSPIFSPGSVHRRCEDGESPEPPCSRCSAALQCHHRRAAVHAAGSPGREWGAARAPGTGAAGGAGALRQAPLPRAGRWGRDRMGWDRRGWDRSLCCGAVSAPAKPFCLRKAVMQWGCTNRVLVGVSMASRGWKQAWATSLDLFTLGLMWLGMDQGHGAAARAASHPSLLRALLYKPLTMHQGQRALSAWIRLVLLLQNP